MDGEIDVGAFFFRLDDFNGFRSVARVGQWRTDFVAEEMSEEDFDLRSIGLQGPEVDVLSLRLRGISRRSRNASGKIFDLDDVVVWLKDILEKSKKIQPLICRAFQCPVVEVEAVYIDNCSQRIPLKSKGPRRGPAPCGRNHKGC